MDTQKRYYLKILAEALYSNLKLVSEGTATEEEKKKTAAKLISDFYEENKGYYELTSIQDVIDVLDEVKPKEKSDDEAR